MASRWTLERLQQELDSWDLAGALQDAVSHPREMDRVLHQMWAYHHDLVLRSYEFAAKKTHYERLKGKVVLNARANGERSAEVATMRAEQDDDVYYAHLDYRAAEQLLTSDREALKILHATLDKLRTEAADARAADTFTAQHGRG